MAERIVDIMGDEQVSFVPVDLSVQRVINEFFDGVMKASDSYAWGGSMSVNFGRIALESLHKGFYSMTPDSLQRLKGCVEKEIFLCCDTIRLVKDEKKISADRAVLKEWVKELTFCQKRVNILIGLYCVVANWLGQRDKQEAARVFEPFVMELDVLRRDAEYSLHTLEDDLAGVFGMVRERLAEHSGFEKLAEPSSYES